jgi:hypothetical protein
MSEKGPQAGFFFALIVVEDANVSRICRENAVAFCHAMRHGQRREGRSQPRSGLVREISHAVREARQKLLGPAWSGCGRPPAGYFTKRTAEDWLRDFLDDARRGVVLGSAATGASFAEAAEEYLRFAEQDRGCKPSTIRGYRSQLNAHLLPALGLQNPKRQHVRPNVENRRVLPVLPRHRKAKRNRCRRLPGHRAFSRLRCSRIPSSCRPSGV